MPPPLDGGQELMDSGGDRVDVSFAKALTTKVDRPAQGPQISPINTNSLWR
jgi:hypothetical protein